MRHEQMTNPNLRDASIAALASGSLLLSACGASIEADTHVPTTTTMLEQKETTIIVPTTMLPTTESTATTTTLPETTTTTIEPLPDWYNRIYEDNGCDDGIVMPVIVQGDDGRNITAQVSWDFDSKMNGQKLDENGNPIEDRYSQYSDFVYINPELPPEGSFDQGINQICIEDMPPNSSVHVEVYKIELDYSNTPYGAPTSTEHFYGAARSAEIFPGKNQVAQVRLPKTCRPQEGWHGDAGAITVHPFVGGQPANTIRAAGWALLGADTHYGRSIGFAAEDVIYEETLQENALPALAPNQNYLGQFRVINPHTGNSHEVVIRDIPVEPCTNTDVNILIQNGTCMATYAAGQLPCTVDEEYVG